MTDLLKIGGRTFESRLFVGTGKFSSPELMLKAILASESQMITVAMKRVNMMNEATDDMLTHINREQVQLLPKHVGCTQRQGGCPSSSHESRDLRY